MKPTLLILAAGMGSRYGGLKQLDGMGPKGETILEYSVYDAIQAGFGKVVFVIRRDIEEAFRESLGNKFAQYIEVDYVFQELDNVPEGIVVPKDRIKPWGTGHAVMVAADAVREPFLMINADDFYGREAFDAAAAYLSGVSVVEDKWCLIGYQVANTLSDYGTVSRGVTESDSEGNLQSITERHKIARTDGQISFEVEGEKVPLADDTLVSMNMMGFTPTVFNHSKEFFQEFIQERGHELKSEFYIPVVMARSIQEKGASVKLLECEASWFGVTYQDDKVEVQGNISRLTEQGRYPSPLWQ